MGSSKLGMDNVGFYTLEKIVKLSPTKQDDIIFDAVIKPVWDKMPFGK